MDGTRTKAVNNKDRNFTRTSLQEFIRAADERPDDYLRRLDEGDVAEGATGGGAREKALPRGSRRSAKNAAATGRFWRRSSGPARARYR